MTMQALMTFFGWCTILNYSLLLTWFLFFVFARDWVYRLHGKWFSISPEHFDRLHYEMMGLYKIGIFLFNLMPFLALYIIY